MRDLKYPFLKLPLNRSFFVRCNKDQQVNKIFSLRWAARRQCGQLRHFMYKKHINGIRVWRVPVPKIEYYPIENGIQMPEVRKGYTKYPISLLKVKQSFFVKAPDYHQIIQLKRRMASAATMHKRTKEGRGKNFTLRAYQNGVRMWRIK